MGGGRGGFGHELRSVHDALRVRVSAIEDALELGADDPVSFRDSCLAFCRALRRHHAGEDAGAFVVLRRHHSDLGGVLDSLVRDHEFLDPMLRRLDALAAEAVEHGDRVAVERELAGIAAVLENHLAYEERVLVAALDGSHVVPGSPDDEALRAPLWRIFDDASRGGR